MLEVFIGGIVAFLMGIGGAYIAFKTMLKTDKILDISEDIVSNTLNNMLTDVEMQKQVYSMGILLGNGLKTGLGLKQGRGKFKMDDLIGLGAQWFFNKMGGPTQNPQTPQQSNDPKLGEAFK